jgi:hypothetical protein
VIDVTGAIAASRPGDAAWFIGTGKGHPRADVIDHGHITPKGNVKTYVCGACGDRLPATRFPTLHRPTADGRTRNTKECRSCRDDRTAAARDAVVTDA